MVLFPSQDGIDVAYEGTDGWKGVSFAPQLAHFSFVVHMIEVFSLFAP